jgi:hypothetical protein
MDTKKLTSSTPKSFLERVGRILKPILTELNFVTGWSLRLILLIIFIGYLAVQALIKWQTKLLDG